MARRRRGNLRYGIAAIVISFVLWGMAHGRDSLERGYDIPVVFDKLADDLVIIDATDSEVNIRVLGSRAALRNLSPTKMEYSVNVSGAKVGLTIHEVDVTQLDLPRGVKIVSRSPAQLSVKFERRGRKNVTVRVDLVGEPPEGFELGEVVIEPARVWLAGARSRVLRLKEVVTEPIDLSNLEEAIEKEVRLSPGSDHVWVEEEGTVKVRIAIEPVEAPEGEEEEGAA